MIFAGGRATRLGGTNKALLEVGGQPIVARLVERLGPLVGELVAGAQRTAGLLKMLEPYGIRELAQSGLLAMGRGPRSITERIPR